jgi:hypothetical protein
MSIQELRTCFSVLSWYAVEAKISVKQLLPNYSLNRAYPVVSPDLRHIVLLVVLRHYP